MQVDSTVQTVLFFCLLAAASLWDIKKRIIPDTICLFILLIGLPSFNPSRISGLLLGLPFFLAALSKKGGMGGGDIKLTAASGFVMGLPAGWAGLIIGMTLALCWSFIIHCICWYKRITVGAAAHTALPLAPFLSAGFIAATILKFGGYL